MDISSVSSSFKAAEARATSPAAAPQVEGASLQPQDSVRLDGAAAAVKTVKVSYNSQDNTVIPATTMELPATEVGKLANTRMHVAETLAVTPDADGNYVATPESKGFDQTNTFASTDKTLNLFQGAVGHEIKWNFSGDLDIKPHNGDQFNAYYDPRSGSTNFCGEVDKVLKKRIEAAESMEVVSHETGHAILDGMRPGLLGWFSSAEAGAFHEAFGDLAAMVSSMQDPQVIDKLVEQTKGDLSKDNIVARMGEQLSQGINHNYYNSSKPSNWTIRNANNSLTYAKPSSLPQNPSDETQLGSEVHNFSRLWSGAMFEVMTGIVNAAIAGGASPKDALVKGRDALLSLTAHGVELGPDRMKTYGQMASAVIKADSRYHNGEFSSILKKVFAKRKIVPSEAEAASMMAPANLKAGVVPSGFTQAAGWLAAHQSQLGIPEGLALNPQSVVRNDRGETFVTYGYVQEVPVGDRYSTDLGGTLTVGFDKSGNVFHKLFEPVDEEQIAYATQTIEKHIADGEIRGIAAPASAVKSEGPARPPAGEVVEGNRQGMFADRVKIARIPYAE